MWEVGVIIAAILVVDMLVIGIYKALRRTSHGERLREWKQRREKCKATQ